MTEIRFILPDDDTEGLVLTTVSGDMVYMFELAPELVTIIFKLYSGQYHVTTLTKKQFEIFKAAEPVAINTYSDSHEEKS